MSEAAHKTIYLIRHGQSEANASPVYQGNDSPLSARGREQATIMAGRFKHLPFQTLLASPLPRAAQTAAAIADVSGHTVEYSDLFIERQKPSSIGGKPWTDDAARQLWRQWEASLYQSDQRAADAENLDDIIKRADTALEYLLERPEQQIVVVTHGYFLRAMVARVLLGDSLDGPAMYRFQRRTSIENTAVTVLHHRAAFEEAAAWRLWSLNDHSHIAADI